MRVHFLHLLQKWNSGFVFYAFKAVHRGIHYLKSPNHQIVKGEAERALPFYLSAWVVSKQV